MNDVVQNVDLISKIGLPLFISICVIFMAIKWLPKWMDNYFESKKKQQEQYDTQLNIQNENTKAVTAALERSNIIIERNTQVIERNTEVNEKSQEIFAKYNTVIDNFGESIDKQAIEVNKNSELLQKTYTEIVRVHDKVN